MVLRFIVHKLAILAALALIVLGGAVSVQSAHAQSDNPELGDVSGPDPEPVGGGAEGSWSPPSAGISADTYGSSDEEEDRPRKRKGKSDHDEAVGHLGVGFFGVTSVPVAVGDDPTTVAYDQSVSAPTVGVRYWLSRFLGIEVGLGLGISSGSFERDEPAGTTVSDPPSTTAIAIHGGVPLCLLASDHFGFQLVPALDFGFATGTVLGATAEQDVDVSGLLFQVGAMVGAEIHFGFIGIPQLALEGGVGLHVRTESRSADFPGDVSVSQSELSIGTNVGNNPWDFFTETITAIYYFH
jgi:hypothetical protein